MLAPLCYFPFFRLVFLRFSNCPGLRRLSRFFPGFRSRNESLSLKDESLSPNGFLPLTDSSEPEAIYRQLEMSKKTFKKAVGALYKDRKIVLKEDGIYLA